MRSLDDLTMHVYGLLDEAESEAMKAHLDSCAECREKVERIAGEHQLFQGALSRGETDGSGLAKVTEGVLSRRSPLPNAVSVPECAPPKANEGEGQTSGVVTLLRVATGIAAALCIGVLLLCPRGPTSSGEGKPKAEKPSEPASTGAPSPRKGLLAYFQTAAVGSLTAQDEEGRAVGELGLKSHQVSVEILDGIAKTTIEENFENHTDRRLEGTLHFPLPPDASISRLALEVNGKIEEGTCLERERAREVFESIVRQMKDPALLEWMPGGIFKCRIFPIEPRSTKRVIIAYTQALPYFRGKMTYLYPLVSEKTRTQPPEDLRIEVLARFSTELRSMESPSHRVDVQRRNDKEATLTFSSRDARPKSDFVVTLETHDEELRVIPHRQDAEDGYFALLLTPQGAPARRPDRYVFILDVSASVTAPELEVEKRLVRAMMENRIEGDRFEILASNIDAVSSGEVELRAANDFMDRLIPLGGSDLLSAFRAAPEGEIIYIGKGAPTYGETDSAKILAAVKGRRIRTIGVGSRANIGLLQKLGGHFRVSPSDNIPKRVQEIAATLGSSPLLELRVEGGDAVYDLAGLRDIFFGERLVITGRYRGTAANLVVRGRDFQRQVSLTLPSKEEGNNYVRRLWAQRKVVDLLAEGDAKKSEVTDLGVKHQIMTPYTSFLVLESEQMWKDYRLQRDVQKQDHVLGKASEPSKADPGDRQAGLPGSDPFSESHGFSLTDSSETLRRMLRVRDSVGRSGERHNLEAPVQSAQDPAAPGFTRFSLVSNGAAQSIDLPRLSDPGTPFVPLSREVLTYAEVRTTTNQFGGLEFSLGETTLARVKVPATYAEQGVPMTADIPLLGYLFEPSGRESRRDSFELFTRTTMRTVPGAPVPDPMPISPAGPRTVDPKGNTRASDAKVFPLKYLQPPATYTAKVEPGRLLAGRPLQPAADVEDSLRRFELLQMVRSVLTKDTEGRPLGALDFDPNTNCLIVRDTPEVMSKVAEIIALLDVEPMQVVLDFKFISTTNQDLVKLAILGAERRQPGADVPPQTAPVDPSTPFQGARPGDPRSGGGFRVDLSQEEAARLLRSFQSDPQSRLLQEPTLAVIDKTQATVFVDGVPIGTEFLSPSDPASRPTPPQDQSGGAPVRAGLGLVVIPKVVAEANRVILTFAAPQASKTALMTRLVMESGRTAVLEGKVVDRPAAETKNSEQLLIFVTPRIVKSKSGSSDSLQQLLKLREEQELREFRQKTGLPGADKPAKAETADPRAGISVVSLNAASTEVVLSVGGRGGVRAGEFFAIARDREFLGIVRIVEASDDRARGALWAGLGVGRMLPGDRAERVRSLRGYLEGLPPAVKVELGSRASMEAVRAKMVLGE